MPNYGEDLMACPLCYAVNIIGGKWKPSILFHLYISPNYTCRYATLKKEIPWKISHKMFTSQLRELEYDGLVARTEYNENIPRVEYHLTSKALGLMPAMMYMRDWAILHSNNFPLASLENTLGQWEGNTIKYKTTNSHPLDCHASINFDVGFSKEELSLQKDYYKLDEYCNNE